MEKPTAIWTSFWNQQNLNSGAYPQLDLGSEGVYWTLAEFQGRDSVDAFSTGLFLRPEAAASLETLQGKGKHSSADRKNLKSDHFSGAV